MQDFEEPIKTFDFTYHRTFPYYIKIKCGNCGTEQMVKLSLDSVSPEEKRVKEEIALVKKVWNFWKKNKK